MSTKARTALAYIFGAVIWLCIATVLVGVLVSIWSDSDTGYKIAVSGAVVGCPFLLSIPFVIPNEWL